MTKTHQQEPGQGDPVWPSACVRRSYPNILHRIIYAVRIHFRTPRTTRKFIYGFALPAGNQGRYELAAAAVFVLVLPSQAAKILTLAAAREALESLARKPLLCVRPLPPDDYRWALHLLILGLILRHILGLVLGFGRCAICSLTEVGPALCNQNMRKLFGSQQLRGRRSCSVPFLGVFFFGVMATGLLGLSACGPGNLKPTDLSPREQQIEIIDTGKLPSCTRYEDLGPIEVESGSSMTPGTIESSMAKLRRAANELGATAVLLISRTAAGKSSGSIDRAKGTAIKCLPTLPPPETVAKP